MTDKYAAYLAMMHQRDQVLATLAALAVGLVISYKVLSTLPNPWAGRARLAAQVGGLILFLITLGASLWA